MSAPGTEVVASVAAHSSAVDDAVEPSVGGADSSRSVVDDAVACAVFVVALLSVFVGDAEVVAPLPGFVDGADVGVLAVFVGDAEVVALADVVEVVVLPPAVGAGSDVSHSGTVVVARPIVVVGRGTVDVGLAIVITGAEAATVVADTVVVVDGDEDVVTAPALLSWVIAKANVARPTAANAAAVPTTIRSRATLTGRTGGRRAT